MVSATPLVVVFPERVAVPPLKSQVPLIFNAPPQLKMPPLTERLPAPVRTELDVAVNVPPLTLKVAPDAALIVPEVFPPPVTDSVPLLIVTVPVL